MSNPTRRERVAANVRAEAARLNETQADIAAVLGVAQQTISAKLAGKRDFRLNELDLLAVHYGVAIEQLVADRPERVA